MVYVWHDGYAPLLLQININVAPPRQGAIAIFLQLIYPCDVEGLA